MRNRLLVRLFLRRFFEHDLVSSNADRREVLTIAAGTLVSISLFLSTLIALQYQFSNFLPPGITSVRSLDERFLFVSGSMLVMALLAVALWDALALEPRDAAVLGVLPLPRGAIVRAKFCAVALVALATDVGWNLAPTLWRPVSLPLTLPVHFRGGMVLMLAQALVTMTAGGFSFLAVVTLRETLAAILGPRRFSAVSSWLQAALLVVLTSGLLLLPGSSVNVARTWLARGGIWAKAFPPLWFVGLHESIAGSVLDNLPRVRAPLYLLTEERDATPLYRSLWPLYRELGRLALAALVVLAVAVVIVCAWNSRRMPTSIVRRHREWRIFTRTWRWIVTRVLARSSMQQAGFWFTLQTLPRQVTHRVVLASSLAVGLSMTIIAVRGHAALHTDVATAPLSMLAAQALLVVAVLTGLRLAVLRPADQRASGTFGLAWNGDRALFMSGVKRAGWIAVVLPVLALLSPWHAAVFGMRVAVFHLLAGIAFSVLTLELLFLRYRRVPLVSNYVPVADLKSRGVAYVAAAMSACFLFGAAERMALETTTGFVVVVGLVVACSVGAVFFDQASQRSPTEFDLDENVQLPTQRLDLAG